MKGEIFKYFANPIEATGRLWRHVTLSCVHISAPRLAGCSSGQHRAAPDQSGSSNADM